MHIMDTDIAIIGGGGAGLSAAIAAAEHDPNIHITLLSKVYPMRSHTVAAEGGAAGVIKQDDSVERHFYDTVSGGDWLCEQDVVELFVKQAPNALAKLERLGCPWARQADGTVNVRRFGGMGVERTWFAADKSGFHILHTLFQASLQFPQIKRLDEYFVLDLLVNDNHVTGLVALNMMEGQLVQINAKSVIIATGGAGRVYQYNTNGSIVTGEGMAMAYRHGVPLRDMEFVQYHPTGLPGSGILMTEGCRGEGGILVNKAGYRYLQDYDLGPETPVGQPKNRYMELGPRDKISQAFWHESQKKRTVDTPRGEVVYLDLRHLGEDKINQRLPFIRELAKAYVGVDPVMAPIPVRPTAHYTMGGIATNIDCATTLHGLYAVGECASIGLHGANRLGSNSLSEIVVFGEIAGCRAVDYIRDSGHGQSLSSTQPTDTKQIHAQPNHAQPNPTQSTAPEQNRTVKNSTSKDSTSKDSTFKDDRYWHSHIQQNNDILAQKIERDLNSIMHSDGTESWVDIRNEMGQAMDEGCGIYRSAQGIQATIDKLIILIARAERIHLYDKSHVYNTELIAVLELKQSLHVAMAMASSALLRNESRGAHQRLEPQFQQRDDKNFLKHSVAYFQAGKLPRIEFVDVNITTLPPAKRDYGDNGQIK